MSNLFIGSGNLGNAPELKTVKKDGEDISVTDIRVKFDRPVPDGNDGYEDRGGFWLTCTLWGRKAEDAARVLGKGDRVTVRGSLQLETWEQEGEEREAFKLTAEEITMGLGRVASVEIRQDLAAAA